MIVKYNCKFCGKPGSVEIEDNDATMFCVQKWAKILCCERCADYQVAKRKILDAVKASCFFLQQCRTTMTNKNKLNEVEAVIKERLNPIARRYCQIVSDHWGKPDTFKDSLVEELVSQPERNLSVMSVLESSIRRSKSPSPHDNHTS